MFQNFACFFEIVQPKFQPWQVGSAAAEPPPSLFFPFTDRTETEIPYYGSTPFFKVRCRAERAPEECRRSVVGPVLVFLVCVSVVFGLAFMCHVVS